MEPSVAGGVDGADAGEPIAGGNHGALIVDHFSSHAAAEEPIVGGVGGAAAEEPIVGGVDGVDGAAAAGEPIVEGVGGAAAEEP